MASPTIRSTYALDPETVERLERLARHWKLSRSATLRKLIREAPDPTTADRLAALDRLQDSMGRLTEKQMDEWSREIRLERQAATRKMLRRAQPARQHRPA